MADDFGIADILGLLGGAFKTYSAGAQQADYGRALRDAANTEKQLYNKIAQTTPAQDMAGIMALKTPLSQELRNAIIQEVASGMASRGLGASTGLVQQAIAEALVKAELPTFQMAMEAYYKSKEMPIRALPRTLGAAPPQKEGGSPFAGIVDLATQRKLWDTLLKPGQKQPDIPGAGSNAVADLISNTPALPQADAGLVAEPGSEGFGGIDATLG